MAGAAAGVGEGLSPWDMFVGGKRDNAGYQHQFGTGRASGNQVRQEADGSWTVNELDVNTGKETRRRLTPTEEKNWNVSSKEGKAEVKQERYESAVTARDNRQFEYLQQQGAQQHAATMAGLQNQTQGLQNSLTLGLAGLQQQTAAMQQQSADRAADRTQQSDQFNANLALQTEQIKANNKLLSDRMLLEDKHFQQKIAYDEKASRRAKVISSLSLVAQSLSRL